MAKGIKALKAMYIHIMKWTNYSKQSVQRRCEGDQFE